MEKKTFIIKTGEQSGCIQTKELMTNSTDDIHIHDPEAVIELDGWHDSLYTKAAIDAERAKGQKEAWELARKIVNPPVAGGFDIKEMDSIFGTRYVAPVIRNHTYEEAIQKIQAWEKEKNAIHVGDIVLDNDEEKAVVLRAGSTYCTLMYADSLIGTYNTADLKKTGKTVDVSAMLNQIKEA